MVRKAATPKKELGDLIDDLWKKREEKREAAAVVKKLDAEEDALEQLVLAELELKKVDGARGGTASVSKTKADVANIVDWEAYLRWVVKTKNFQCVVKRANDLSWREQVTLLGGKPPPGTEVFEKTKLSLRTV